MTGMSALVLRIVFSCSFPLFSSLLLFRVCLPLSLFFHSHYFCFKQRTPSCFDPLMGSLYTWGQASKPESGAKLCIFPLLFSHPLPHHSFLSPIAPFFPLPCLALLLEGSSALLLAHLAEASLDATWRLWCRGPVGHCASHSSPLWCILSISTTQFSGKGTVCYSVLLPTVAQHSSPVIQGTICFFNMQGYFDVLLHFSELTSPLCSSFLPSLLFF